ncbi:TonB-dependent receptor [Gilvimarinus polysaccharolyticus]|uniref:TonB-dependent receptor n=1 Tax=Gilvimarinus polysaccharolyticus TaxID=863921 RepID=UPI000673959B|nr:TonB-dependent siderophore receptor [Gilvimarinus polysaccharolyticus]
MNYRHLPVTIGLVQRCALASAVGLAISSTAFAQTSGEGTVLEKTRIESSDQHSYKVDAINSPKRTQPILDTAATQYVLTEQVMDDQGVDSLQQALRNVPGITIAAGEGGTNPGDNLSIRGFDSSENIYTDGVRDTAVYERDIYNLEQLEVTLGPSSSYSGRGSTGGSVNLITKTAKFDTAHRGTVKAGTDDQLRATIDLNQQLSDTVAARVNLLLEDSGTPGRDVVENTSVGIAPSLAMQLGETTRLDLYGEYLSQDNIPDFGIPMFTNDSGEVYIPDGLADNFYGFANGRDTEEVDVASLSGKISHDISDNTRLTSLLKYAESDLFYVRTSPRLSRTDADNFVRRDDIKSKSQARDVVTSLTDITTHFTTGAVQHDLNIGVEFTQENLDQYVVSVTSGDYPVDTPLLNPNPNDTWLGDINEDKSQIRGSESETYAIYAFDTLTLNQYWELTGGVRLEQFDLTYSQNYTSSGRGGETPPFSLDSSDTMLSWSASTVFKPAKNGSIYFGVGTAFTPAGNGLTLSTTTADLDPEEALSYELGTKWDLFGSNLLASAAVFRTVRTNAQTTDADGEGIVLDGEQQVDGIEFGLTGNITDALQIQASAAIMDTEVTKSNDADEQGNDLVLTPENTLSIWANYTVTDSLKVAGGVQHMGEYSVSDSVTVPSYQVLQLMVSYQLNDAISFQLNGDNLTDERYISSSRPGGHAYVGDGRSVTLGANFSF